MAEKQKTIFFLKRCLEIRMRRWRENGPRYAVLKKKKKKKKKCLERDFLVLFFFCLFGLRKR